MDPLSITVSVITLLGAGGTIAKGLDRIRSLRTAPDILLQLYNEISDLHLLLHAIDGLYRQNRDPDIASQQEIVCTVLKRAKDIVLELEKVIVCMLTKETDSGTELDRVAWMLAFKKIKKMQNGMRNVRHNLNAVWIVVTNR
ncbi:hypothetical protein MMC14_007213 [Varicellaria rhodocarpa]|nr:hypothetical protein [Varicellaria rhodocarpa]